MADQEEKRVGIYFQQSPLYRTIRTDGAWAGITPQLEVQFALFNDLRPMPEYVLHQITEGGLGDELERVERKGIRREVEIEVIMNPANVEQLINLLRQMLDQVYMAREKIAAAQANEETQVEEAK